MSSVHYSLGIIKLSEGRSAVKTAAYIARERIYNHRTGKWCDYTRKGGLVHSEILLPEHAPEHYHDRAILWNCVEHREKAQNAQLSRTVIIGLPIELDRADQIALIREHVQKNFVDRGMCADVCLHKKGKKNYHAHVMLTMRPILPDGSWGEKSRKEYVLDRHGQRMILPSGEYKSRKVSLTGWDDRGNAEIWRDAWEKDVNREYERLGIEPRIDMRSFEKQGLDKEPTRHLGPAAAQREKEGKTSYLGDCNREIEARNAHRERQKEQTQERGPTYEQWLEQHKKELSRGMERGR